MNKNSALILVLIALLSATFTVSAEPRTKYTDISSMRPYTNGDYFITLASNQFSNGTVCTNTYKVQSSAAGAKAVIASLLTAYASGQKIQIEVPTATGCQGFGTPIQSVFMFP